MNKFENRAEDLRRHSREAFSKATTIDADFLARLLAEQQRQGLAMVKADEEMIAHFLRTLALRGKIRPEREVPEAIWVEIDADFWVELFGLDARNAGEDGYIQAPPESQAACEEATRAFVKAQAEVARATAELEQCRSYRQGGPVPHPGPPGPGPSGGPGEPLRVQTADQGPGDTPPLPSETSCVEYAAALEAALEEMQRALDQMKFSCNIGAGMPAPS